MTNLDRYRRDVAEEAIMFLLCRAAAARDRPEDGAEAYRLLEELARYRRLAEEHAADSASQAALRAKESAG